MQPLAISQKNKQRAQITTHVLLWGILFCIPLFLTTNNFQEDFSRYIRAWIPLFFAIIVFYTNYTFLIRHYLFRRKVAVFLLANALLIIVCLLLMNELYKLTYDFRSVVEFSNRRRRTMIIRQGRNFLFFLNGLSLLLVAGVSVAIKVTTRWYQEENLRKEMAKEHLQSELSLLKHQLNPHFFFNTLNNIYSLVELRPNDAQEAIHRLGKLMRYLLYESESEEVPLGKEITFLRHYIDLMRLRLPSSVEIGVDFPADTQECRVAPLLFVSLVENAFKHGVSATQPSFIRIHLQVRADKTLDFSTQNSFYPKNTEDKSGSGIGLSNLRKRLELLYPERHQLTLLQEDTVYKVQLIIKAA